MAKQTINIGSGELAGNGESIRSAFSKINDNFDELYANGGGGTGVTGPQGPSGAVGPSGADGAVGPTGPAGTGGTSISTSDTTPLTPELGDLWYDTVSGRMYVYYDSGWVDANPSAVGPIGPQGPAGSNGVAGPQGPQGVQGNVGATGPQGPQGVAGATGPQGVVGATGPQGVAGSTGAAGPQGPQGVVGAAGPQGPQGVAGTAGSVGATGPQGDPGPRGLTGDQGVSVTLIGSTSTSAGLPVTGNPGDGWIVLDSGNLWFWNTIDSAWNDIGPIVGPQGDVGDPGPRGADGDPGAVGPTGPQGDAGPTGPQGVQGDRAQEDRLTTGSYSVVLGADGVLTLPSGNTRIGDVYGAGNDTIAGSTGTAVGVLTQGTGGYAALQWIGDTTTSTTNAAAVIVNSPFSASSGTVQIATGAVNGPVTEHIWEFGANGILTLPNGLTIDGAPGFEGIQIGGTSTWISVDNEGAPPGFMVATAVGGADHRWLFADDGTLTAPGHLLPNADLAYDLGSTTTQWRSIYVGTGTIFIGGVALGVNQDNYVTVDGNPIITVTTSGSISVQGDTNIILGSVVISDTAPDATTPGSQWFNTVEARTYVAYNEQWVDASPTVLAPPDTNPDVESITFNDATVQITAWPGTFSYNDLTDKPVSPTFVGGGGANTWLTAE